MDLQQFFLTWVWPPTPFWTMLKNLRYWSGKPASTTQGIWGQNIQSKTQVGIPFVVKSVSVSLCIIEYQIWCHVSETTVGSVRLREKESLRENVWERYNTISIQSQYNLNTIQYNTIQSKRGNVRRRPQSVIMLHGPTCPCIRNFTCTSSQLEYCGSSMMQRYNHPKFAT